MLFKTLLFGIIFLISDCFLQGKQIQFIPNLVFYPTWKTKDLKEFKNLNGIWRTSADEIYRVPFVEDEKKELILRKEFFLGERLRDTLYLYFEGMSWSSEVYLNGRLLAIYEEPFQEILIKIPPELFNVQWNWVEVHLKKNPNQTDEWGTRSWVGIHKSVFLLQKGYNDNQRIIQNAYTSSDSVLVYFPFSLAFRYNISEKELIKDLEFMKMMNVKAIYIPYYITPRMRKLLNDYHIRLLDNYKKARYIAIYRSHTETNVYPFWFKEDNERSSFLGNYVFINSTQLFRIVSELSKPLIIFWGFFVLVLLLIYRLVNLENYKKLWILFPSIREIQQLTNDFHLLNSLSLKYFSLVRVVIKSLVISLFINQLHSTDNLRYLNVWHKNNVIYNFAKEYGESVFGSFAIVFMFFLIANAIKIMIWQFAEWVYRLRDYRNKNLVIEVYGEMPFLFYSFLGLMAMMLVGGYVWLIVFIVSYGILVLKKQYFLITAYNMNYKIPFSVIFFYLCGLELLPWLLLI
ncbi:MAG: hypothetical protein KatS3mg035_0201 [Bacteroidia bacterium]|nr:MAG: hypothetical protein KatS3mg035_0201 [Bacteroidia bacterium]